MATANLNSVAPPWRVANELRRPWLLLYAAVWLSTLCSGLVVVLLGAGVKQRVRSILGAHLHPSVNAPPSIAHLMGLAAHNLPIECWPVLLGALGAHQHRTCRHLADIAVGAALLLQTAPVGAAIGTYGSPLLSYIPQLPLEWVGLALGASTWLLQRRRPMTLADGLRVCGLAAGVLLVAAAIETFAVPHR